MNPGQEKALSAKKRLFKERQPGETGGRDFINSQTEHNFRQKFEGETIAAPAPASGGQTPAATFAQPRQSLQAIIDRFHKEGADVYGGYVTVCRPHGSLDTDQVPPNNPGYVTTVQDGINKAVSLLANLKAGSRVGVLIFPGTYNENPSLNNPGIDLIGIGRPEIVGKWNHAPTTDTIFYGIDFAATDPLTGSFQATGPAPYPNPPLPQWYDCRFYSDGVSCYFQRKFYMEHCQFFQTSDQYGMSETYIPLVVEFIPQWDGAAVMKDCQIRSWTSQPDYTTTYIGRVPLDAHPGGYAIHAFSNVQGPYGSNNITGSLTYEWPGNQLTLINCDIYGSELIEAWQVEHIGGSVHGAAPIASHSGKIFGVLRGIPQGGSDLPGHLMLSGTNIYAAEIATVLPNQKIVIPLNPGVGYVQVSNCNHFGRWDGGSPTAFEPSNAIAFADVVNTPTNAASWTTGGWTVSATNSPVGQAANRRFYLM